MNWSISVLLHTCHHTKEIHKPRQETFTSWERLHFHYLTDKNRTAIISDMEKNMYRFNKESTRLFIGILVSCFTNPYTTQLFFYQGYFHYTTA